MSINDGFNKLEKLAPVLAQLDELGRDTTEPQTPEPEQKQAQPQAQKQAPEPKQKLAPVKTDTQQLGEHKMSLTKYGQQLVKEIQAIAPDPVLILGESGMGKSILAKSLASSFSDGKFWGVNGDQGMRLEPLVGLWHPTGTDGNVSVAWGDGSLTEAVRTGGVFLLEEITRVPEELKSLLYGLLDTDNRSWVLTNKGGESVPVHEDFWFMATGNPSGNGYNTNKQDKAFLQRFSAIYTVTEPLAPEQDILETYLSPELASAVMRMAVDARSNSKTYLSTRDLVTVARHVKRGILPVRAVEIGVASKYAKDEGGINELARLHLAPKSAGYNAKDISTMLPPTKEKIAEKLASTLGAVGAKKTTKKTASTSGSRKRTSPADLNCAFIAPSIANSMLADGMARAEVLHDPAFTAWHTARPDIVAPDGLGDSIKWRCNCNDCAHLRGYKIEQRSGRGKLSAVKDRKQAWQWSDPYGKNHPLTADAYLHVDYDPEYLTEVTS